MNQFRELKYYIDIAKRRFLYFFIPFVLAAVGAVVVVLALPSVYQSRALILVESQQIPEDLVRSTVTALADERLQVIEQRIKTRDNVLSIAEKFGLFKNKPGLTKSDLVDLVRERIFINQVQLNMSGRKNSKDRLTVAFTVGYEDENPQMAARVANELVTVVLAEDVKARTGRASETTAFLEGEAKRLADQLLAVENQMAEFRQKNADSLPDRLQFNMQLLEKTEANMAGIERDLASIEEQKRLLSFEQEVKSGGITTVPGSRADLQKRINDLKSEIATKSSIYADSHPEMRLMRKALAGLEVELAKVEKSVDLASTDPNSPENEQLTLDAKVILQKQKVLDDRATYLKSQREQLIKTADDLKQIIARTTEISATLATLERQQTNTQKALDEINEKYSQARLGERLEENQQAERFEVIEQPITPQEPSRPQRPKLMALGVALAGALGAGIAFAAETLDSTIRSSGDFESRLNQRPYVVIPYIPTEAERRKSRRRIWLYLVAMLAVVAIALLLVHLLYMPLDILWYKIIDRL